MPHLPDWVIERLRRRDREGWIEGGFVPPEPDPCFVPDTLASVSCPDPDCNAADLLVLRSELPDGYVVRSHSVGDADPFGPRCWMSGLNVRDAREIIRLREENGGRLKRAAHP